MKPVIGQPVQFIANTGDIFAATIVNVISDEGAATIGHVVVTLRVTDYGGSVFTVAGVEEDNEQLIMGRNVWRALPVDPVGFPVAQFVDAVRPLIEEVTRMHVEEELANRKEPT